MNTESRSLGRVYESGQAIIRQGEAGDCMYVIQEGQVQVLQQQEGREVPLAVMGPGDFFGEMSLFEREARSATVRALGQARVLTVDKRTFMVRVHEDPSLAYRIVQTLCHRLRKASQDYSRATSFVHRPPPAQP